MKTIRLGELLKRADYLKVLGSLDIQVSGLAYDSRRVEPGNVFICIEGFKLDGHLYIPDALGRGAIAVVMERIVPLPLGVTAIIVPNGRIALAQLGAEFYGYPSTRLGMVGVTGTNGKTTTTHLIESILREYGRKTGLIGTIANRIGDKNFHVEHTTPESLDLQRLLRQMVRENVDWTVMEVSSHALSLHRVDQAYYDLAVFTNLTQDHLDFHPDFDHYLHAKLKLFQGLDHGPKASKAKAVVNIDDPHGEVFIRHCGVEVISYGIDHPARVRGKDIHIGNKGAAFQVVTDEWSDRIYLNTTGLFSVYNALAAIGAGVGLDIPKDDIIRGISKVRGVSGRFEQVDCGQEFTVIVDYAHTPDGLKNILETANQFATGKIIVVFGCGGDRDKTKRPLMGEIAAKLGHYCVITSDNPRSEDPIGIIDDIVVGVERVEGVKGRYKVIPDRREAISCALSQAGQGDLVIIAGKGHETYQILKDKTIDFDDREVVRDILRGGTQ